ncbi:MAG: Holliday junction resolvase RuvX [Gammaproteobacteria bacterium]|jgi:putative Holliday junction resolvase
MPDTPEAETVIAFDFGLRRIGVAVGQALTRSATALTTLSANDGMPEARALDRLVGEWQPDRLLLGTPLAPGEDSLLKAPLQRFRERLEAYGVPVEMIDEQFSSTEAQARLAGERRSGRRRRRVRKADVDSLSACIIAEQWLRQH